MTRSWWRLTCLCAELPPISWQLARLTGYKPCDSKNMNFSNCYLTWNSHCKSASCFIWCAWVLCWWEITYFILLPTDYITTSLRGHANLLDLLVLCHHPDESWYHKHCDSRNLMFLICCVTSPEVIWIYGWKPPTMNRKLTMLGGHLF